jgi:plastocyanin
MRLATRALRLGLAAFALWLMGMATTASAAPSAATSAVAIQGFAFVPASLTVNVGDTVRWTNTDPATHTVTSNTSVFNSTVAANGGTFAFQFGSAGTFAYHCDLHPSMTGTVVVRAAATPAPTPVPTPIPTAVPTSVPTVAPTARPTAAPTAQPTVAPTAQSTVAATEAPTVSPTSSPTPAVSAAATSASVVVASPASAADATPAAPERGPDPLVVAGAAVIVVGLAGLAWVLLRR